DWGGDPARVDYGRIYASRFRLLALAKERGFERDREAVEAFARNRAWLAEYALYMACKRHFDMRSWQEWPEAIRLRKQEALAEARAALREDVELFTYIQFLFFKQWDKLREYVHQKGVKIIGDLPIYVAMDSADVWANPGLFQLDEKNAPRAVAGVPPDYFSEDGQLWGNPLYDWEKMKQEGYAWWMERIAGAGGLYDIIRIDHFRGFDTYWSVPPEAQTARPGHWEQGPGMDLIGKIQERFPHLDFIAEDLGTPMESLTRLLAESGWPGMKVLEFAFDPVNPSSYVPHRQTENCICYTATHDNLPLAAWWAEQPEAVRDYTARYIHQGPEEPFHWAMIRCGMGTVARIFMAQMQDYLGLGREATTNRPGTLSGNWQWRLLPGQAGSELADRIRALTRLYER
ncbi:MAG: 4-alpha-glucanotransferase, partial [Lachnospiraceae bacterium]|nr:4-alpha-glucanotransferase [Lachnospiraceae bacterium]